MGFVQVEITMRERRGKPKMIRCPMCGKEVTEIHDQSYCCDCFGYECRTLPSGKYWCMGKNVGDCVCLFKGNKIFFAGKVRGDLRDGSGGFLLPIRKYL